MCFHSMQIKKIATVNIYGILLIRVDIFLKNVKINNFCDNLQEKL